MQNTVPISTQQVLEVETNLSRQKGEWTWGAAWILWLRGEYGIFEKVSYGGRVLRNASAMIAEREALRMGIEHLTEINAQSLRLFGLHRDVNDAHRAGANRLQNKTKQSNKSDKGA